MKIDLKLGRVFATVAIAIGVFVLAACTPEPESTSAPDASNGATAGAVDVAAPIDASPSSEDSNLMTGPPPLVESVEVGDVVDGKTSVTVSGTLPDDCTQVTGSEWARQDSRFVVGLVTLRPGGACPDVITPFEHTFDLPLSGLDAGTYEVSSGEIVGEFELLEDQAPASGSDSGAPMVIACAEPTADQLRLVNLRAGFCLNYPATYAAERPLEGIDLISDPSVSPRPNTDEFGSVLSIDTIPLDGATAASLADERLADLGEAESGVTRTTVEVEGQTVIVADGVPGIAMVRMAFVVREGTGLAHIVTVMPIDPSFPELTEEAELLWQTVINSIRFFDPQGAE